MRRLAEVDPAMLCCDGMRQAAEQCAGQPMFVLDAHSWHIQNLTCMVCGRDFGQQLCAIMHGQSMFVAAYQIEIDEGPFDPKNLKGMIK